MKSRFQITLLLIGFVFLFGATPRKKMWLIYTHNGEGYVHENIPACVTALKELAASNGYLAESSDKPDDFSKENLRRFDCIIFANTNNEAFETEEQRHAFMDYVHEGGGFVGIHSASGSERKWPWFWELLGGKFVRHPKLQTFTIKVVDKQHPSTSFLGDTWEWEDECYYLDNLNPGNRILLAADLSTVEDEKQGEYPGTTFGRYFPLAWCHEFEGGRQFYTALGHKAEYYKDERFLRHILGGIQWVLDEK